MDPYDDQVYNSSPGEEEFLDVCSHVSDLLECLLRDICPVDGIRNMSYEGVAVQVLAQGSYRSLVEFLDGHRSWVASKHLHELPNQTTTVMDRVLEDWI